MTAITIFVLRNGVLEICHPRPSMLSRSNPPQVHTLEQQNVYMAAELGNKSQEAAALLAQRWQEDQRSHLRDLGTARRPLPAFGCAI